MREFFGRFFEPKSKKELRDPEEEKRREQLLIQLGNETDSLINNISQEGLAILYDGDEDKKVGTDYVRFEGIVFKPAFTNLETMYERKKDKNEFKQKFPEFIEKMFIVRDSDSVELKSLKQEMKSIIDKYQKSGLKMIEIVYQILNKVEKKIGAGSGGHSVPEL